jgi:hypothetical protein
LEEEDEALIKSIFQVSTGISTFTSLLPMSSFLPPLHFSFPSWGVVVSNMVYFVKNLFCRVQGKIMLKGFVMKTLMMMMMMMGIWFSFQVAMVKHLVIISRYVDPAMIVFVF